MAFFMSLFNRCHPGDDTGNEQVNENTIIVLTAEVKYWSCKMALKTARDGEKNMTHDSVNIFFKLLLKNLL